MADIIKKIERVAVVLGIILLFLVALEILQAYDVLSRFHPFAGYSFIALLLVAAGYLIVQFRPFFTLRSVPQPPDLEKESFSSRDRKLVANYLEIVARRLTENPSLMEADPDHFSKLTNRISGLDTIQDSTQFKIEVIAIETEEIATILTVLDDKAEEIVSDNVGIVSLGTAMSPYRSLDFGIVLIRNVRMVNQVMRIYRTRPTPPESLAIFYDVTRVVAMVNLLNAMDQVWTGLGRHLPVLGTYGEAVSEGLFSGLLTSVAGHAAIDRCRSYKPWSKEEAARKYRSKLNRWGKDILSLMRRHGLEKIKSKFMRDKNEVSDS